MKYKILGFLALAFIYFSIVLCLVGSIRGYSIQSLNAIFDPIIIGLLLIILRMVLLKKKYKDTFLKAGMFAMIFFAIIVNLFHFQWHFAEKGKQLYKQRLYRKALENFQTVYDNRILQLGYNTMAPFAMTDAANCYCQLADFEQARKIYTLAGQRYPNAKKLSQDRLQVMNQAFQIIANYIPDTDPRKERNSLFNLATTYQYKLFCDRKALEVYKKIMQLDVPDLLKKVAAESIKELSQPDID